MAMKTWQKTALALSAISVFAGLGYVGYHFLYKLPKEKKDAEKGANGKDSKQGIGSYIPTNEEAQDIAQRRLAGEKLTAKEIAIEKKSAQMANVGRGDSPMTATKGATTGRG